MEKPHNYIVIDDDSTNNLICRFVIKKFDRDAKVQLFKEPEKALYDIERGLCGVGDDACTILFLDVNMPAMSGFEFLDEFENFPADIRSQFTIYILTSSIEDFTEQAKNYPMVKGFFSKPLKESHLAKVTSREQIKWD